VTAGPKSVQRVGRLRPTLRVSGRVRGEIDFAEDGDVSLRVDVTVA
jgi:hypothetical protein